MIISKYKLRMYFFKYIWTVHLKEARKERRKEGENQYLILVLWVTIIILEDWWVWTQEYPFPCPPAPAPMPSPSFYSAPAGNRIQTEDPVIYYIAQVYLMTALNSLRPSINISYWLYLQNISQNQLLLSVCTALGASHSLCFPPRFLQRKDFCRCFQAFFLLSVFHSVEVIFSKHDQIMPCIWWEPPVASNYT